jgi:asparagine synthase (glutamine-hydrolysing)
MCGFAGIARRHPRGVSLETLGSMAASIRHRGPDGYGFYCGQRVGLAHVRLSIVDLAQGAQPMSNEDGTVFVAYNGEIYNHRELARELSHLGHRFRTQCDTEVLVHGWEQWGPALLDRLNGQFAFALYDRREELVFLARDRFGVRPLFYTEQGDSLIFGSEIKALFASGEVPRAADPQGLDEIFTYWAAAAPRTAFLGVKSLEPGCHATWNRRGLSVERYYHPDFSEARHEPADALEQLDALLRSSVELRMRADVPVGAYVSGGLDSSITSALAAQATPHDLRTFSIGFADPMFDEGGHQRRVAELIGSQHADARIEPGMIASVFPEVIRHTETPLLRTAPAPMYLLAQLTRQRGIKVVLTGEGADELFLGYDLFKEVAIREFCLRQPDSSWRPALFQRLYPYLGANNRLGDFWPNFFLNAGGTSDPMFSHLPRMGLTGWAKQFYGPAFRDTLVPNTAPHGIAQSLPAGFPQWSLLGRAAYLEMRTLMASYLLSSQGDRMGLAFGVEGRFPFLDHRLFEFAAALPARSKLRGLHEKDILRRWADRVLPTELARRPKHPYRAPDARAFAGSTSPEYVDALLSPDAVRQAGFFSPAAVTGLARRCLRGLPGGVREDQAFVGILSTQLWHQAFLTQAHTPVPLDASAADVLVLETADAALTVNQGT